MNELNELNESNEYVSTGFTKIGTKLTLKRIKYVQCSHVIFYSRASGECVHGIMPRSIAGATSLYPFKTFVCVMM